MRRNLSAYILCTTALISLAAAQATQPAGQTHPRVAVVYSGHYEGGFASEFDQACKALAWRVEKFKNIDVAALAGRLNEFDYVISTTVGNYDQPQEMGRWKEAWLDFLKGGGVLLIVDANYESVLDKWVNTFGPEFKLTVGSCRKGNKHERLTANPECPLLAAPHAIGPMLLKKSGNWAHFDSWQSGWTNLIVCPEGKSLFLVRKVGKGVLAVTSYSTFFDSINTHAPMNQLAGGLFDNLQAYRRGVQSGLLVTGFQPGPEVPGTHQARVSLRNISDSEKDCRVILSQTMAGGASGIVGRFSVKVKPNGNVSLELPYEVSDRGVMVLRVDVVCGDHSPISFQYGQKIPSAVTVRINELHVYPFNPKVRFGASFVPDADVPLEKCRGEVWIDGRKVVDEAIDTMSEQFAVDVSKLEVGKHKLVLKLMNGEAVLGQADEEFYFHPMPRVYSDLDGVTRIDGKPFFPFGWYHVSWTFTPEERLACLRDIAAAGFNTIHASLKQDDQWDVFLDEAKKLGVYVITEFGVDKVRAIERYKNHPAILAWNPGDEPDGGSLSIDAHEMFKEHKLIKAADPDHPTYLVLCNPPTFELYANGADVVVTDPYPLPVQPIVNVYKNMVKLKKETDKNGRGFWGVIQSHGYAADEIPNFAQVRNMTYQALLAGVKGIIYYTYADYYRNIGFKVKDHPELWAGLKTLPAEIKALEPAILNGKRTILETGDYEVPAGVWEEGDRLIVCVVNASEKDKKIALALPGRLEGAAKPMFDGRPSGCFMKNGKIIGKLGPLEVHVYEVKTAAPAAKEE